MLASLPAIGYGLAGAAFLILTVLLLTSWQGRLHGALLTAAAGLSALWGVALAVSLSPDPALGVLKVFVAETLRNGAWLVFLSALFAGGIGGGAGHRVLVYGGPVLAGLVLLSGIGLFFAETAGIPSAGTGQALITGSLGLSLFGLILLEQIYRNARSAQRSALKFLCLGLLGLFAYDLVLYSQAILFGRIDEVLWSVRGIVAAFCVPLIAVSAQRNPEWSVGIFVSRQVVFYTTTLMGVGIYLILMAAIGYYIKAFGGEWGPAGQVVFFAAAILILGVLVFSERLRARLKVFISKHFFRNRYDYREEWLRLMHTLSVPEEPGLPLAKRGIKALCDIVVASAGVLYLREDGRFRCTAGWNTSPNGETLPPDHSLVRFLEQSGWVIDADEYRREPPAYEGLEADLGVLGVEPPGVIVPLVSEEQLLGFVALARSERPRSLNYEDHDLLKTAGRQIASYLDQEQKKYQLAESRQFEAFNRLTAYLMHDLKNLIAQQSLVVENAYKHKDKPEFIDDAIRTVESGVARMKKVLEQLKQGAPMQAASRIEVGKLVMEAVSQCADRRPEPRTEIGDERLWIRADRERLLAALIHAVRNAQDATPPDGNVRLTVEPCDGECAIRVIDTGRGMEKEFIETRLFKPFDSTKGTSGMGIGAYQVRETVRASGGELHVESAVGEGTKISMVLPLAP
ncbi:XrtA/PEP-CTERM system histidine kinase PrsK [Lentisalinibacter sediminis]|uniref:XrtA/PEP-CTERM system histidine kinase PrsK n=1 Tax=Lentisalinibacter sediminis TaxID=2992237 RepID=UPI0038705DEE